jgi:hypothetical protein
MKNTQRGFIPLLIIILVVAVIGGGAYYYSKSKVVTKQERAAESVSSDKGVSNIKNKIIGDWQGKPDTKDKASYMSDGTYKEWYEGVGSVEVGKWDIVTNLRGTDYEQFNADGEFYLKTMDNNGKVRDYTNIEVSDNMLSIMVLGRGTTAAYSRVVLSPKVTPTVSTNLTPAQIYQEVSSQLGLPSKVVYFRIWGQDRVQYNYGPGTNFAYKLDGKWHLVGKGNRQDGEPCSDLSSVPAQYKYKSRWNWHKC